MIPLDNGILVVESCDDIVIGFNGDSYRGMLRSVPNHFWYKRGKCWTLANVSFLPLHGQTYVAYAWSHTGGGSPPSKGTGGHNHHKIFLRMLPTRGGGVTTIKRNDHLRGRSYAYRNLAPPIVKGGAITAGLK